jgi:hypothetical protein
MPSSAANIKTTSFFKEFIVRYVINRNNYLIMKYILIIPETMKRTKKGGK